MSGKKRKSVDDIVESKECVCGRKFSRDENKANIKKHCDGCNTFITVKQIKKGKIKSIAGYFAVKPPIASNDGVISDESSLESDVVSPPGSSNNNIPSSSDIASDDFVETEITEIPPLQTDLDNLCTGFKIFSKFEFYSLYPFGAHSSQNKDNDVFQTFVPFDGVVFSTKCRDRQFKLFENQVEPGICNDCYSLKSLNCLRKIIERAGLSYTEMTQCQNSYLNHVQLLEKLEHQKATINTLKLSHLNDKKNISVLQRKLSLHQRLLVTLSEKDIPRLRQLIAVALRQKNGISYILNKLTKAMNGMYKPKGYDDRDYDLATFVLIAGGPRLLHVLHQTSGLPSLSSAYRIVSKENYFKGSSLTALTTQELPKLLKENSGRILSNSKTQPNIISIKIDEISIDKRLRYKSDSNEVLGLCCQHTTPDDVIFTNEQYAQTLEDDLAAEKVHLATESLVFTMCSLDDEDYHAKPLVSMPICSHATSIEQSVAFKCLFDLWKLDYSSQSFITNIGTDGDGVRRSVLHNLCDETLHEDVPYYRYLNDLKYMDMVTLPLGITINYDGKHLAKRVRNNLLSGSLKIYGKSLDESCLRVLLKHLDYRTSDITAMISPDDKQNVPIAVKLLKSFDKDIDSIILPTTFKDIVPCFKAMNIISQGVLALFDSTHLSIDQLLGRISAMSHLLLFLKSTHSIEIPNVLYHDLQATVQDVFFTAAKFKAHFPEKPLYIFQLGSDQVEHLFRNVRTQNHAQNCDLYQLEGRLIRASILDKIFIKHSDWKQKSVRLTGNSDYTRPSHWGGNYEMKDVSIRTAWRWGKRKVENELEGYDETNIADHVTILKPFGVHIGVQDEDADRSNAATTDDVDDSEINEEAFSQFEDELDNGNVDVQHPITITMNGTDMYKSTAVRLISNGVGIKKSGDRLRRVQGMSKFVGSKQSQSNEDDNIITVRDPVATICTSGGFRKLLVLFVDKLIDGEKRRVSFVRRDDVEAILVGRPIQLKSNGAVLDVKIGEKSISSEIRCSIKMTASVQLTIINGMYSFSLEDLEDIFNALVKKADDSKVKLPKSNVDYFKDDTRLLSISTTNEKDDDTFECKTCKKKIKEQKMREHVGGHILREEIDSYRCGYCGGDGGCSIELKKTSHQTIIPDSNCLYKKKFSLVSATKSTSNGPCTNRPVKCALCEVVYWSYAMKRHYEDKHIDSPCPITLLHAEIEIIKTK